MPLSPLRVFHPEAATSADVRPARRNTNQENVPAAAQLQQQLQPSPHPLSNYTHVPAQSVGWISTRFYPHGVGHAPSVAREPVELSPEQRLAELQECTAQVRGREYVRFLVVGSDLPHELTCHNASDFPQIQQFLESYYLQLEADLNGFAGLRIPTAASSVYVQNETTPGAAAAATNHHPLHSTTARTLSEVLSLKQHQASAVPPPKPLRDYTAEADGAPSSARGQSSGSISSALNAMHVGKPSTSTEAARRRLGVKIESGAESEKELDEDEIEADADDGDEEDEDVSSFPSSAEDDEDYSESSNKRDTRRKKGVSNSFFLPPQSKSGRPQRRKQKKDEQQHAEEQDDVGDNEDGSVEAGGRGSRSRGTNRPSSPKVRRSKLPLQTTKILRGWTLAHVHHPFPVDTEKRALATMCKLNSKQVSDWFTNNRKVSKRT